MMQDINLVSSLLSLNTKLEMLNSTLFKHQISSNKANFS